MAGKSCPVRALDMTRSSAPLSDSHFGENWAYHKRLGIALISGGRRVRDLTTHPWLARQSPSIGFQKATSQGTLRLSSPACLGAKQERSKIGRLTMFLAVHPYPGGSGSRETMQDVDWLAGALKGVSSGLGNPWRGSPHRPIKCSDSSTCARRST